MKLIDVTPDFSVVLRMRPEDAPAVAARGFAALIGVLPDEDGAGPRESERMRLSAGREGLSFTHAPVVIGLISEADVAAFADALRSAEGRVAAYCHSGLRAVLMWAFAKRAELGDEAVIRAARRAGFDIAAWLAPESEALLAA